jgi:hypothetical protein
LKNGKMVMLVCAACVWSLGVVVEGIYRRRGAMVCTFLTFGIFFFSKYYILGVYFHRPPPSNLIISTVKIKLPL